MGSVWKYLDDGSDQGTAWRGANFDDTDWKSGPATLGYGSKEDATVVQFGNDYTNKYITTYFRLTFNVASVSAYSRLALDLIRDGGAVVYLNGTEIFRSNMPAGGITYTTPASTSLRGASESAVHVDLFRTSMLVNGRNVLAVEVHLADTSSSGLRFNLSLTGTTAGRTANATVAFAATTGGPPTLATSAVGLAPQSATPSVPTASLSRSASVRPAIDTRTSIPRFVRRGQNSTGSGQGRGLWRSDFPVGFDV
jgi:hypothetical protein